MIQKYIEVGEKISDNRILLEDLFLNDNELKDIKYLHIKACITWQGHTGLLKPIHDTCRSENIVRCCYQEICLNAYTSGLEGGNCWECKHFYRQLSKCNIVNNPCFPLGRTQAYVICKQAFCCHNKKKVKATAEILHLEVLYSVLLKVLCNPARTILIYSSF